MSFSIQKTNNKTNEELLTRYSNVEMLKTLKKFLSIKTFFYSLARIELIFR